MSGGYHPPIRKETKDEILAKVKEGQKVPDLARQYGISDRTIYTWVSGRATSEL